MKRALIVEDDRVWAQLLAKWCEQEDIAVEVAGSPQMAMDALDGAAFDVVVVDMLLAAETGMALLNEMAGYDDLAQIPVIVCTNSAGVTQEALAPGRGRQDARWRGAGQGRARCGLWRRGLPWSC